MPINPNIALGIQPIQQPNMLAQYGQMMALRAAQQDTEGYEGVKNAITGGMDAADPRMLQYGKRGIEAFRAAGEGRVKQQEALGKAFVNARETLINVRSPEDLISYSVSQFNDPLIGPSLKAQGLTPEKVVANLQKELSTTGFDAVLKKSAMGLKGWYDDQTKRANAATAAGPGHRQASVAEQRLRMEQDEINLINNILQGRGETPSVAVTPPVVSGGGGGGGGGGGAPMPTAPVTGAVTPVTGAGAQPNVLADQVAPTAPQTSSVNALDPNAQGQQIIQQISQLIRTGPKGRQVADSLIKEYNLLNPTGKIEPDANGVLQIINERAGTSRPVIGADGKPVIAKSPFESAYSKGVGEAAATSDVALVNSAQAAVAKLQDINQTLTQLNKSDAITGFGADLLKDVERFRAQFTKDTKAGKRVADTEVLNAMLGSEVFGMIQSLGIGAKGLDTPAEREYLREVMTGTIRMDKAALIKLTQIRKNVTERAIDEYNKKLDSGELNRYFETRGMKPKRIEKPASPSAAVTDSIESLKEAGLWQYMSPEDQKLWQK